jgi:hypothetical protein
MINAAQSIKTARSINAAQLIKTVRDQSKQRAINQPTKQVSTPTHSTSLDPHKLPRPVHWT